MSRDPSSNHVEGPTGETVQIEIAGFVCQVVGATGPLMVWLKERYRPFLSENPATVVVTVEPRQRWPRGRPPRQIVDWEEDHFRVNLAACRGEGNLTTRRVHLCVPPIPSALGPSVFRTLCSLLLHGDGGFLLHASGVIHDERAWVFCGPSESGKTTIARLADERPVLSDETVAIVKREGTYAAFATPFFGEGGPVMAAVNSQAAVRGFFFLRKAKRFSHRQLSAREVVERAFPQVLLPKTEPTVVSGLLGNLTDFAKSVPCYDLYFPPRPGLWGYLDGVE